MPRGNNFALGREPSRDADGHSLPSDTSMRFVEVLVLCKACRSLAPLAVFFVYTHHETFPGDVNERLPNKAITERQIMAEADGSAYIRFKFTCPHCPAEPVLRQDTIDDKLRGAYRPGAVAERVYLPV